jgi:hypothetical protein
MITESCDKYIKKAKIGLVVLFINILFVLIVKSGYLSIEIVETLTSFILFILLVSFIAIVMLINPYMVCLSKYKIR